MPIYEYRCANCDARFEQLIRSPREERKLACPECGGLGPQRELSVFSAHAQAEQPPPARGGCGQCCEANGECPFA
ncbi:MAG: zinc ribbon domain-containing protein [Planctomycetes bacterium]|nr:zinc ribbon domain-containing protein [Planctomycetota bacterium]